ncbi:MAG: Branched-chain amino acid transporter, amino acid-binding protein [Polyangiaceae bacterium]|nr:Branched-chain amino acid transporter, amino acid-binding protein [Polyangiaceae bacterium]
MLRVRVFSLPGGELPADAARASIELSALGDFEPSNDSAEVLPADRAGAALRFPAETQAVQARLPADGVTYAGYGERRGDSAVDLLLWPERETAILASSGYPGRGGGQALGFGAASATLLMAGGNDALETDVIVGTLRLSATTGVVERGGVGSGGLAQPRAFATVTPFGEGFLVAGGQKPLQGVPEAELDLHATAEIVGAPGRLLPLQSARTHHAALALADGRTLLVGGRAKVGNVSIAQYQLEIVDPVELRASVGDAIAPRIDPIVLSLSDGRIFVGGGTLLDGSLSAPVGEWLNAEARRDSTRLDAQVPPRFERAFVATLGGGVLAVGGCEDRPPASQADAAACDVCQSGCPPLDGWDAWWIDADGGASSVSLRGISAPRPVLLPGSDGRPWLVAADGSSPEPSRLFRFNPWGARFDPVDVPSDLRLPRAGFPALALAPDSFAWVDDTEGRGELLGLRLGARSRFTRDVALVLSSDPEDPSRPAHLAPTCAVDERTTYDGALTLADPSLSVLVTDTDYADLTIRLTVVGTALPRVQLGGTTLGGDDCPWPEGSDSSEPLTVVRRGGLAQLRHGGAGSSPCPVGNGRLTVALVAGPRPSVVGRLEIVRKAKAF